VSDVELAKDLAQETFLRAYVRFDQFDPSRRFGPWLFRIGVNLTFDHLRRRRRRGKLALFTDYWSSGNADPQVDDPRGSLDTRQEVELVLTQVPEKYRTVLILRDMENFSTSEIAAILNRKEATIRWRLAEARNMFQRLWTKRQGIAASTEEKPTNSPNEGKPSKDRANEDK
jgi:RNA polymerase sigma-70 factor (ECF subfamily)